VKRFRRSAADFKLDIPELVRPPDVLERVCGYLEEWVMVRYAFGVIECSTEMLLELSFHFLINRKETDKAPTNDSLNSHRLCPHPLMSTNSYGIEPE
jgi:hypothetical protein